ncbi:unnamed protein product [Rhizoctonia solani]|uniref:Uncharacterized protein n=1 Tax=Rhizoctonia solani TaxID=456999 RepID=A0A8H3E6Y7_9AGAM|nr:unnamed protein product [Rhizoctonia solani]
MMRCDHCKLALTLSITTHCITFNAVSTLLAVSSATDTVHIFKLKGGNGEGEKKLASRPSSPGGSADSQETGKGGAGMEGGYEAYMDGKKKNGVGFVDCSIPDVYSHSIGPRSDVNRWVSRAELRERWAAIYRQSIRNLGTLTRLCLAQASDVGYEVYRGAEQQYGKHDGRLSSEGFSYSYTIDLDNGGECLPKSKYSFLGSAEDSKTLTTRHPLNLTHTRQITAQSFAYDMLECLW